ncbi:hypothetical protein LR48_Vigan04g179700 [Vigna angularis]|uniref:Pentatricopeptide repeat-containing protein n=1 Tax=Phaseolus angularis TaxID=3914 RepID=A0A0L9UGC4_PHAAN|nr:hypothetical protein LR48_Vigan04g179700 [Vigna angularis]
MCVLLMCVVKHKKIVPDFLTYTSMINGLGEAGNVVEARQLFSEMFSWNKMLIFNVSLIQAGMVEKGLTPNVVTYTTLVDGLCKRGEGHCKARNRKEAWFLHNEMVEERFSLTAASYNALIKGFCKRKFVQAKKLFEMKLKALL